MKYARWSLLVVLLLAATGLYMPSTTHAQPYFYRWGPTPPGITCSTNGLGEIRATFSSQPVEWDLPAINEFSYIYDYNGSPIFDGPFPTGQVGIGSFVFGSLGSSSLGMTYPVYYAVTLNTIIDGDIVYKSTLRGDCAADGAGTTFITNGIVTPDGEGPGPDMVSLPGGSVVGAFVSTTPAYFAPTSGATTTTIMEAGKTVWVTGVDASGSFYRVVLSGQFFWVPVETMGPNFDDVWNGTPLPSNVVS